MSGRLIAGGLVLFALVFGATLWWFQTRGYYAEVTGLETVEIAGASVAVSDYRGIDAETSPLKMRGCFSAPGLEGPPATEPTPLVTPGWFDCFDAETIAADLASGDATAILAEANEPYGFDRIVAVYPDGRAFMWRQINHCGAVVFEGDPTPADCPPPPSSATGEGTR